MPLVSRGRTIGVLQLLNPVGRDRFDEDDLRRMRLFAGPLAHALENARLYAERQRTFVDTVTALAEAVEKRDPYTGGHLQRVVAYSLLLGDELDLTVEELESLRLGATLHDIGKIGVPDGVLLKAGPLDEAEAAVMRRHTVDGAGDRRRASSRSGRCCRSCATTTSGSTDAATRTGSRARRSRCRRGSSRSPTPSTR